MLQIIGTAFKIDLNTPFEKLPKQTQDLLLFGPPPKEASRTGFHGVLGFLRQNLADATSDSYREWLLNYLTPCKFSPGHAKRPRPECLAAKVNCPAIGVFTGPAIGR